MTKNLMSIASEFLLVGGHLSSNERYTPRRYSLYEGNDNCDCSQSGDCYCTDCNEGSDFD